MGVTLRKIRMKVQTIKVLCSVMHKETEDLIPAPIHYSHKILRLMAEDRKRGTLKGIEPDSRSQVTMLYDQGKPLGYLSCNFYSTF